VRRFVGEGEGEKGEERLKAPDQNRTDTSSLEGYGSTIELQAQYRQYALRLILLQVLSKFFLFSFC
jgi:hypothetical protein